MHLFTELREDVFSETRLAAYKFLETQWLCWHKGGPEILRDV